MGKKVPPSKGEEKRPFTPYEGIDTNIGFHFGLLSPSCHCEECSDEAVS